MSPDDRLPCLRATYFPFWQSRPESLMIVPHACALCSTQSACKGDSLTCDTVNPVHRVYYRRGNTDGTFTYGPNNPSGGIYGGGVGVGWTGINCFWRTSPVYFLRRLASWVMISLVLPLTAAVAQPAEDDLAS